MKKRIITSVVITVIFALIIVTSSFIALVNINTIDDDNIYSFNLCTHCEKENKLFSYRASNGTYGRLFSFSYIK